MFDIGFWELSIIALVGLIVIGPERLPGVARTVGKWVGRTRRFVNQVKNDIDSEIKQDELRKALENETGLNDIKQELDSERYSFEEEKDYLVDAMSDEKENKPSAPTTEQDEPEEYIDADSELTKSNEKK
ncbi:MAG: Sec-independent protein translocase protein TatB [Gammaproteobacteria bacterium]|nr:Sec-independent protein translocase protein TatB [Gammaproteobacteria bacterium]